MESQKGSDKMIIRKELDFDERCAMWTIYDKFAKEVCKIIMEDGDLSFYIPVEDYEGMTVEQLKDLSKKYTGKKKVSE